MLLEEAELMFPEGQGAPRAMRRDGTAAEKTNELLVNAKKAIDQLGGSCADTTRRSRR